MSASNRWAAVLAGGAGTRFWPASRSRRPKPFIDMLGRGPLIELTVNRIVPLVPRERVLFVVGEHLVDLTRDAVAPCIERCFVVEPVARNTLGAVLLAMGRILSEDPDGLMIMLPSDHLISNLDLFGRVVDHAFRLAARYTVALGIRPTKPETGYGYIKEGAALPGEEGRSKDPAVPSARKVDRFVEKPDLATAQGFLDQGGYYWNSGMFIFSVPVFLRQIEKVEPGYADVVRRTADLYRTRAATREALMSLLESLPNLNIDKAVMERCDNMVVLPAHFPWSDVGTWDAVFEERGGGDNFVLGDVLLDGVSDSVVVADDGGPAVAVQGLSDVIVVSTRDAVLVARRGHGQDVGRLVQKLREMGREELL